MRNPLNPHSADALYRCGFYRSTPYQGQAVTRGSSLNDLLAMALSPYAKQVAIPTELREPFDWGLKTTLEFAKGNFLVVDRLQCKVDIPGINRPGYCDCVVPGALTSIDWKSGQKRSYTRQMAMYALGQMTARFALQWTCVILFLDDQESEFHRFNMEEAHRLVLESRMAYDVPDAPKINESCNWCANFFECPRQLELAGRALAIGDNALDWPGIIADPNKLGQFLLGVSALKEFDREGRERAREFFFQNVEVPGFRLSNGKRTWSLPLETLFLILSQGDDIQVRKALRTAVEVHGAMSKEQYFELCEKLKIEPDKTLLKESRSDPFVTKKGK